MKQKATGRALFHRDGQGGPLQKAPYGQKSGHSKAVRHSVIGKSCTQQKKQQSKKPQACLVHSPSRAGTKEEALLIV